MNHLGTSLKDAPDLGGGFVLDLSGVVLGKPSVAPPVLRISGIGRPGNPTDGWEYNYVGYMAWAWPNGVEQIPAIVNTVVRAKPHGHQRQGSWHRLLRQSRHEAQELISSNLKGGHHDHQV